MLLITWVFLTHGFSQEYSRLSVGVAAGGAGWAGVPIQYRLGKKIALDLGLYARTAYVDVFEKRWYAGPSLDASLNLYLTERLRKSTKQILWGIYLKGGRGIWKLDEYFVTAGSIWEIHKLNQPARFLQLQVGPSLRHRVETYINTRYPPGYQEQVEKWYSPMIYFRLVWFFPISTQWAVI